MIADQSTTSLWCLVGVAVDGRARNQHIFCRVSRQKKATKEQARSICKAQLICCSDPSVSTQDLHGDR